MARVRRPPVAGRRPRVPLPRQRGGPHADVRRRPFRKRKHKTRDDADT